MAKRVHGSAASLDKISQLPQVLLQHIQYYLSPKQAVQTVILSKAWLNTWSSSSTRPNFNLDEDLFQGTDDEFLSLVHNTLQGYHDHKLRINAFKLGFWQLDSESHVSILEKWIPILIHMGVNKFHLNVLSDTCSYYNYLPSVIFEAESFIELSLKGCRLDKIRVHEKVMFKHLKVLKLSEVCIEEKTFQRIISSCPLIEDMQLKQCEGLRNITVNNLQNLKEFYFMYYDRFSIRDLSIEIGVSVTNLKSITILYCANWFHVHKSQVFLNLKYLSLTRACLSGISLYDFSCYFPSLKKLKFTDCYGFEEIKILSRSIQHISLKSINRSIKARIDAPNIRSFRFSGSSIPTLSIVRTNSKWSSEIYLNLDVDASSLWFKLNEMLTQLSESKISLHLWKLPNYPLVNNIVHFKPMEVEKLKLSIQQNSSDVNGLFFVCRPRNVDVYWYVNANCEWERGCNELAEDLCKILMEIRENGNQEFTWQQDLKEVSLNTFDHTKCEWRPLNVTSLRKCASPNDQCRHEIRLKLKWTEDLHLQDECEP